VEIEQRCKVADTIVSARVADCGERDDRLDERGSRYFLQRQHYDDAKDLLARKSGGLDRNGSDLMGYWHYYFWGIHLSGRGRSLE
jgi:hypothetical protein